MSASASSASGTAQMGEVKVDVSDITMVTGITLKSTSQVLVSTTRLVRSAVVVLETPTVSTITLGNGDGSFMIVGGGPGNYVGWIVLG